MKEKEVLVVCGRDHKISRNILGIINKKIATNIIPNIVSLPTLERLPSMTCHGGYYNYKWRKNLIHLTES